MRGWPLLVLLMLLAGCAKPGAPPAADPLAQEPGRPVGDVGNLTSPLLAGPVVAHKGAWLVAGNRSVATSTLQPQAWRIDADGHASRLPDMEGAAYGRTWVFGRSQGDTVQLIGYTHESGFCCARYGAGMHSDGYYERSVPMAGTWTPQTGAVAVRPLQDCGERGRFGATEADGTVYLIGGRASQSTDVPARFDAREILRLRADGLGCEPTGAMLPVNVTEPALIPYAGRVLVVPPVFQCSPQWFSPRDATVTPAPWHLPFHLSYDAGPTIVAGDVAYLLGVLAVGPGGDTINLSRVLRVDLAGDSVAILQDVLDRRATLAAAFWADGRIVLAGGIQDYRAGETTMSLRVSLLKPSDEPASLLPPVARFVASSATDPTNLTVTFDGSASSDPDGRILAWRFELPMEGSECGPGPCYAVEGPRVTLTYPGPGDYTARLTVTDDLGLEGTQEQRIHIAA